MNTTRKITTCLVFFLTCSVLPSQAAYAAIAGHAQFVKGSVQITDAAGQTRILQKGDAVNEGDTLISAKEATAQIKMQDGGFVAMRADTKLKFDSFIFSGKQDGTEQSFFSLFKGGFRAVTGLIGQINKPSYRITTPAATIGIRGTDHETFMVAPGSELAAAAPPGAYNKVNLGETYMATDIGTISVLPNQMGFAGAKDQMPQLQPINTNIFTVAPAPALEAKAEKKEEKEEKAEAKQEEKVAKEEKKEEEGKKEEVKAETVAEAPAEEEAAPVRETAVVDATAPPTPEVIEPTVPINPSIIISELVEDTFQPPPRTDLPCYDGAGNVIDCAAAALAIADGMTANLTTGTVTTAGGQNLPVTEGLAATQAQAAADATLAAANAAQAALNTATADNTTLAGIAQVDTAPATTAISTAAADIGTANTAVTAATALLPADAATTTTNAASAQAAATAAAIQAAAAQAALDANTAFPDSTAAPANQAVQSANSTLQAANTTVQTAAGTVTAQNTALATAQSTASTASNSANTSLSTANTSLATAITQNAAIVTAQESTVTQLSAAATAATWANTAAANAQAAATLAASLQAAGDLAGAQAQLLIAQQEQAFAQTQLAIAQAAQSAVATQLAAAQAAAAAAGTAVTDATNAANLAASDAATANTQAAAAQTASTNASAALAASNADLATVNSNAAIVAANAPIAAYNNPAVVTTNRFVGVLGTIQPDAASGYIEGGGPGAGFTGTGTANTSFVLDGAGNLVESRHTWYEETPASTATPQIMVPDANVKRTGGTAVETFKLPDNSIYAGRWQGGSITVTDNAAVVPQFTRNLGVTSKHWAILLAPPAGYVQTLAGTFDYNKVNATSPTDALGNVGTLNNATLTANFTSQLVDAALNLTIAGKTLDVVAASMAITGGFFNTATQVTATCTGCGAATYYANVGGGFAGNTAASAGLNYTLWTGAAPGATTGASDLIQGMAAFSAVPLPMTVAGNLPVWPDSYAYEVVATGGAPGAYSIENPWGSYLANTAYGLDAANNLLEINRSSGKEYFSGGVAQDTWSAPDGTVYMGRWQGGSITTLDSLGGLVGNVALGSGSAHWIVSAQTPINYVQTLAGMATYTLAAATAPTDALGNTGTLLNTSRVTANFTNQLVDIALNIQFSGARTDSFAVTTPGGIGVIGETIWGGGTVACTGANCDAGGYSADLWARFAGSTTSNVALAYHLIAGTGTSATDVIQGAAAFSAATAPSAATNPPAPPAGNWTAYGVYNVEVSAGQWLRARFNDNGLQPATSFVLDGSGNLVKSLHANYREQPIWRATAVPQASYNDATITYSGGVASDYFTDGNVAIGRWTGGTMTITDNATVLPTLVKTLGAASSSWSLVSPTTAAYAQSLVGPTTYNMVSATSPVNSAGVTGTVTSASVTANFTNQTVDAAIALSIALQNLTLSATAVPMVAGTSFFDALLELGTAPTVTCVSGTGCSGGGYLGRLGIQLAGATAASAEMGYMVWPTAPVDSTVSDMIRGEIALSTATAPSVATNPPAGTWSARGHMLLGSAAAGWQRGRFNDGGQFALPETSFILDGAGNLVRSLHVDYNERYVSGVSPAANQYADAMVTYSGGTASDHFTDGSVAIGRWTGGTMTIVDNLAVLPTLVNNLGVTSSYWFMTTAVPVNYVQSLVGTTTYTQFGATLPTDSFGNVGTTPTATLVANFTNQTVASSVAFTIASQGLNISNQAIPIVAGTETFEGTLEFGTAPTVSCTGAGCSGSGYLGWLTGGFAGAQAASANLAYKIWPTAPADSLVSDLIQGVVAFNTTTPPTELPGGPFAAYVPSGVTVALSSPSWVGSQYWDTFTAVPADIGYTGGLPSGFIRREDCPGCGGGSNTTSVLGAANPVSGMAISNTGIEFGRWTTSTAIERTYAAPLGTRYGAPDGWMYGPQGYMDAAPLSGSMAGTFTYQMDGNTAPYDRDTGLSGTLTSAMLTADFTTMTVSAALGLTMPGSETWAANVANQPVGNSFSAYAYAGGAANTLTVTRNAVACPTCGGSLMGGFTGQNFAGAILSYHLYDNTASGNVVGRAALTRNFAGNTNPVVVNNPIQASPGTYFVADYGGSLQWVDAITATGNLLTAYSGGYSSTTVTCTTCTTTPTGDVANSGIYYGTWQAGDWTNNTWSFIGTGQFHWITGPEAGPVYLPQVLTGTVTYALDGGTAPTNQSGTAGTLDTATLTVNFTKQVVGISLDATVAGNTWSAYTATGNEAPLDYNTSLGRTAFYASSYQGGGPGTLTVSVSNANGTLPTDGWVSGNLTGGGLSGAVLSYTLYGNVPTTSWDHVNGVAAFVAPPSDIAAPYRMVGVALTDPYSAVPLPGMAGLYNAASRMTSDATGNLTQFDISPVGGGTAQSLTVAQGTSTLANFGSDSLTGISWGRWQGGVINVTDRATGVVTPITLQGSAHWIAGPTMTAPVTLPVSGPFTYTLSGGTLPTNNLGVTGTLNSATLSADFTAQTVDIGVNATVGTTTLGALATGVPIMQGAAFGVGGNMGTPLTVTCAGTCGAAGSNGGVIAGGFTGAGATGAGVMYSLGTGLGGTGATVISGAAAFHR